MLNLVLKRIPPFNKFSWNVGIFLILLFEIFIILNIIMGLWSAIYEEIADHHVQTIINSHTNIGVLYKIEQNGEQYEFDATYKMLGNYL